MFCSVAEVVIFLILLFVVAIQFLAPIFAFFKITKFIRFHSSGGSVALYTKTVLCVISSTDGLHHCTGWRKNARKIFWHEVFEGLYLFFYVVW